MFRSLRGIISAFRDGGGEAEELSLCEALVDRVVNRAAGKCDIQQICTRLTLNPPLCGLLFISMCVAGGDEWLDDACQWISEQVSDFFCPNVVGEATTLQSELDVFAEQIYSRDPGFFPCVGHDICSALCDQFGTANRCDSSCSLGRESVPGPFGYTSSQCVTTCCLTGDIIGLADYTLDGTHDVTVAECSVEQTCIASTPSDTCPYANDVSRLSTPNLK